eukprot:CAMPEP_0194539578 /NCGR_PEP_ID=MMETSP0253-20130528/79573_1 /TAXON_ID=2966 /ORGANISM="Noctiluca scintillans" /LENGTH=209 /DNA_ID=CAMNT_0039385867 /DNA_START=29 /DNA_END=654 /DNA_ORIENTATION=-
MAGLVKRGRDANVFGSRYQDTEGGFDAGNGKRTYTKPTYTLFVVGIPDAESSDSVESVFRGDIGFLQCRPVGHKRSRRMVFVDYGEVEHATRGMQAHQGHKWEPVDVGLQIDYDHDARTKRNVALDEGRFEKFWPCGPRKAKLETDGELFARLKAQAHIEADAALACPVSVLTSPLPKKAKVGAAAKLLIKEKAEVTTGTEQVVNAAGG